MIRCLPRSVNCSDIILFRPNIEITIAHILPRTVCVHITITRGDFRHSSELPLADFSQPFRLEMHLFDQRNLTKHLYWLKATFNYLLSVDERCFSQWQHLGAIAEGISNHAVSILRTARGANKWREAPCETLSNQVPKERLIL